MSWMKPADAERLMREVGLAMAATRADLLILHECGQFEERYIAAAMGELDTAMGILRVTWQNRRYANQPTPATATAKGGG